MQPTASHRIAHWLLTHRALVFIGLVVILGTSFLSLKKLYPRSDLELFFQDEHLQLEALRAIDRQFGGDEVIYVYYEANDVFEPKLLAGIRELGTKLEALTFETLDGTKAPMLSDVLSLANVKDAFGAAGQFESRPLVPDPIPTDAGVLSELRRRAANNPIMSGNLVNQAGTAAGLWLRINVDVPEKKTSEVFAQVQAHLDEAEGKLGLKFWVTGTAALQNDVTTLVVKDTVRAVPIFLILVSFLAMLYTGRIKTAAIVFLGLVVTIIVGLAMLPMTGTPFTPLSGTMPRIFILIAGTSFIHYLSELGLRSPDSGPEQLFSDLLAPVFISVVTTAIGFAVFLGSDVPAIRMLGGPVALGTLAAFVIVTGILSVAFGLRPPRSYIGRMGIISFPPYRAFFDTWGRIVTARPGLFLAISAICVAGLIFGAAQVKRDFNYIDDQFDPDSVPRMALEKFSSQMGGADAIVIAIRSKEAGGFLAPDRLRKIEELDAFLRSELHADRVISVVDWVKVMHRAFLEEDPAQFRIPDTKDQVSQLVLLNGDTRFAEYLDETHTWTRILVRGKYHPASLMKSTVTRLDAYLAEQFPASQGYEAVATGNLRLASEMQLLVSDAVPKMTALALFLIVLVIGFAFRSVSLALWSVVPNALPVIAVFACLGFAGETLALSSSLTPTIILGLAVDDTVHFLSMWRQRRREGDSPREAVAHTIKIKGPAIFWTSITLTIGFLVFLTAEFPFYRLFGVITAFACLVAILGDLVVLPAGLSLMKDKKRGAKADTAPAD